MDKLLKIKQQKIDILQKYGGWGKSIKEGENLLDVLGENTGLDNLEGDCLISPKTRILINTNEIKSPIYLNYNFELPIVELLLDKNNFVIYTTKHIYSVRNEIIKKIEYEEIIGIDENSINGGLYNNPDNLSCFHIMLITSNENKIPITIEHGISFRPILYFLATTINSKKVL